MNFQWMQPFSSPFQGSKTGSRETNHPLARFSPFYAGWEGGHIRRAQWKYWCDAGIYLLCVQEFRTSRVFHFSSPPPSYPSSFSWRSLLDEGNRRYLISKEIVRFNPFVWEMPRCLGRMDNLNNLVHKITSGITSISRIVFRMRRKKYRDYFVYYNVISTNFAHKIHRFTVY